MPVSRPLERLLFGCVALSVSGSALSAQLITPKTVPVAQGDQFNIFPAANSALGGVSIALDDSLLDPWSNPARMGRVTTARFFSAPLFYSISDGGGAGRTLPMGAMGGSGAWHGGAVAAIQQVDKGNHQQWSTDRVSDRSAINQFGAAAVARTFDRLGLSVGGGVYGASLNAVDGVDQMYGSAQRVDQAGSLADVRLGLTRVADGRALDVVLVYDRYHMTHDAMSTVWIYPTPVPVPPVKDSLYPPWTPPVQRDSVTHNEDLTATWGAHVRYSLPLTTTGWRLGWTGTFNKLEHPKIPNYDVMSVPRDPGSTRALNLGVGLSRVRGPTTFGVDMIYEPMWSNTWADAPSDTPTSGGATLLAGGKTIENDFTFSNAIVRMGLGRDMDVGTVRDPRTLGIQMGLSMHSIDYRLRQNDNVQRTRRTQNEDWVEWTPTLGLNLRFTDLEVRYTWSRTMGVSRPGGSSVIYYPEAVDVPRGGGVIVAPSAPLVMSPVHVLTHQLSISLPIR